MTDPYKAPQTQSVELRDFSPTIANYIVGFVVLLSAVTYFILNFLGVYLAWSKFYFFALVIIIFTIIGITSFKRRALKCYLKEYPIIDSTEAIEALKPKLRLNMRLALIVMPLVILSNFLLCIIFISDGISVRIISFLMMLAMYFVIKLYGKSENEVKQIEATTKELDSEVSEILNSWHNKMFPDF